MFWRAYFFPLETTLQETLQETGAFWANSRALPTLISVLS